MPLEQLDIPYLQNALLSIHLFKNYFKLEQRLIYKNETVILKKKKENT